MCLIRVTVWVTCLAFVLCQSQPDSCDARPHGLLLSWCCSFPSSLDVAESSLLAQLQCKLIHSQEPSKGLLAWRNEGAECTVTSPIAESAKGVPPFVPHHPHKVYQKGPKQKNCKYTWFKYRSHRQGTLACIDSGDWKTEHSGPFFPDSKYF